eukprot:COSAG01_NODE_22396_length_857_cov_1.761214_1_plen_67_part_10
MKEVRQSGIDVALTMLTFGANWAHALVVIGWDPGPAVETVQTLPSYARGTRAFVDIHFATVSCFLDA